MARRMAPTPCTTVTHEVMGERYCVVRRKGWPMPVSPVEVRVIPAQHTAVVRRRGPVERISEAIQAALPLALQAVVRAGMQPSGPPFVRYLAMEPGAWEVEIGWPVPAPVAPGGEAVPSSTPAGPAATATYFGPYEGVGEAYGVIQAWCVAHGHEAAGPPWESYLTDPGAEPDPAKWRTDR